MNQIYKVDYLKLVRWLLPPRMVKPKLIALLEALVVPLLQVWAWLNVFRNNSVYALKHNSQVVYMQKVLNDRFDQDLKRIKITDGKLYNQVYIYATSAGLPFWLDKTAPQSLLAEVKYKEGHFDFVVLQNGVHVSKTEMFELKALVDKYKLAGKSYKIVDNE